MQGVFRRSKIIKKIAKRKEKKKRSGGNKKDTSI